MLKELPNDLTAFVANASKAKSATPIGILQTLWSGYGQIIRFQLEDSKHSSVIVKWVKPPEEMQHPRGWNTKNSQTRKLVSYQIEQNWYKNWSQRCSTETKVPAFISELTQENERILVLEDLDLAGYPYRFHGLNKTGLESALNWLGNFHGEFLGEMPKGLWDIGSYWHLGTRGDEFNAMPSGPLKKAAQYLDQKLNQAQFKTLIHGDAKVANFCFNKDQSHVAALDFQYVGAGVGVKDVAYFLGSCLNSDELYDMETWALNTYFSCLRNALKNKLSEEQIQALEAEWRELYTVAIADFARFLEGWRPGHQKLNQALKQLHA